MGVKSDIDEAIRAHGAWKTRFRDFLSGKAGMDLFEISQMECCRFGTWLSEGGQRMLSAEDHAATCELHEPFHQVTGNIVQNIKQRNLRMPARRLYQRCL